MAKQWNNDNAWRNEIKVGTKIKELHVIGRKNKSHPQRHAQMTANPECNASTDKDEERTGSGAFSKMESVREESKRFALDKLLVLCCWLRFYINVLLFQVFVLFKSSSDVLERVLSRVDLPYFCATFSMDLRFCDSVAIFSLPFEPFSSTFSKVKSIFIYLKSLCCFHCPLITRCGQRNICCRF